VQWCPHTCAPAPQQPASIEGSCVECRQQKTLKTRGASGCDHAPPAPLCVLIYVPPPNSAAPCKHAGQQTNYEHEASWLPSSSSSTTVSPHKDARNIIAFNSVPHLCDVPALVGAPAHTCCSCTAPHQALFCTGLAAHLPFLNCTIHDCLQQLRILVCTVESERCWHWHHTDATSTVACNSALHLGDVPAWSEHQPHTYSC
jgi:hypothetical protein